MEGDPRVTMLPSSSVLAMLDIIFRGAYALTREDIDRVTPRTADAWASAGLALDAFHDDPLGFICGEGADEEEREALVCLLLERGGSRG